MQPIENDQTRDVVAFANPQVQEVRINDQYFGERQPHPSKNRSINMMALQVDAEIEVVDREHENDQDIEEEEETEVSFWLNSCPWCLNWDRSSKPIWSKYPFQVWGFQGKTEKLATNICEILEQNTPNAAKMTSPAF